MTKTYVQRKHITATATLSVAGWSSKTQTVSVSGVTTSNTVIVSPSSSSCLEYANAQIRATAQATGTITFVCETVPTNAININAVIFS